MSACGHGLITCLRHRVADGRAGRPHRQRSTRRGQAQIRCAMLHRCPPLSTRPAACFTLVLRGRG